MEVNICVYTYMHMCDMHAHACHLYAFGCVCTCGYGHVEHARKCMCVYMSVYMCVDLLLCGLCAYLGFCTCMCMCVYG